MWFPLRAEKEIGWSGRSEDISMSRWTQKLRHLLADDRGGEVLEYALIAGLIVIASLALIGAVGNKVVAKWTSLNSKM
jgi:Flp pilus assembly pilin Flp